MTNKPELLAPAGGWEALVAAVENGADAVYLGGTLFNARQSASNFDSGEMSRAVQYAHLRGVKIFVTVNVLVADTELEQAVKFLFELYDAGADAAILQDLGLARLAREYIPELPIHASTQMTVHNTGAVQQLVADGFSRVVLAREMSLKDIAKIREETGAELEVFIHGALCISYSGQCLLSSMIGARSGNRGRCAQPCRMSYTLVGPRGESLAEPGEAGEYLLSPRDLNASQHIPELARAGISSFKIEGRMKRPEYVATVVRIYRALVDRHYQALQEELNYKVDAQENKDLAQIFNRDFTSGYLFGRQGSLMMSSKRPNNRGLRLGRVRRFDHGDRMTEVLLEDTLRVGDGVEFWVTQGGRAGFEVGEIILNGESVQVATAGSVVKLAVPGRVMPGDRVFKTSDLALLTGARETYARAADLKKMPLDFKVTGGVGEKLCIEVIDPRGYTANYCTTSTGQEALNRPLDQEYLASRLGKLGNTPFCLGQLECRLTGEVIYPVSEINEARRSALAQLEEKILKSKRGQHLPGAVVNERLERLKEYIRPAEKKSAGGSRGSTLLAVGAGSLASLEAAAGAGADIIYYGLDTFRGFQGNPGQDVAEAAEHCRRSGSKLILSTPRILGDQEISQVLEFLEQALKYRIDGVLVGNLGLLGALAERHPGLKIIGDFSFNVFNAEAINYLQERGVARCTLSPEMTIQQVTSLSGRFPVEVLVHGAQELMVSEYCAPGAVLGGQSGDKPCRGGCKTRGLGLKDRTGAVFPLETDKYCRMHIFNSKDLCLVEDLDVLARSGVSVVRIDARRQWPQYVAGVTSAYRRALDRPASGRPQDGLDRLKQELSQYSPQGFTKGHFYRGILNV